MSEEPVVRTEYGAVRGIRSDGLHLFRAVPYAAPPFGNRRFEPPAPPDAWDGVRDATQTGAAAPQPLAAEGDPWAPLYSPRFTGEDCLTLEICTPELGEACLHVMVHIHGGGYVTGFGGAPGHTGRAFARDGVVHVSINYRLGLEGFLHLGEGRDNLGLRDQTAALAWVQRNIPAFGGDPARVTIFGQSGGGVSVLTHTVMPASHGLFARAIAQSGSSIASADEDAAAEFTRRVARRLGAVPTAAALRDIPIDRMIGVANALIARFAASVLRGSEKALLITPFQAVHGTATLPRRPLEAAADSTVPLLAGTVRNETIGFVDALTSLPLAGPVARRGLRRALALDPRLREAYAQGPRRLDRIDAIIEAAWTDWAFRIPTIRFVERRAAPSWLYEFDWQSADVAPRSGSVHGIELPFARDDLADVALLGQDARRYFAGAPQALADDVHGAFVRFATGTDPGWQTYDEPTRTTMVFDESSAAVSDPAGAEREAWTGRW